MKIRILNIRQAFELYFLIKEDFPEVTEDLEILDFLDMFISSLKENNPMNIVGIIELLFDEEKDKIINMKEKEFLSELVLAFSENRVLDLVSFFEGILNGNE